MNDEFDVNVDDGSGAEIAAKVVGFRKLTLQGDFEMVDEMYERWTERQGRSGNGLNFQHVGRDEADDDTDWDSGGTEENEDEDVDMAQAPSLVKMPKEKVEPKVDEDGFTEVISKKKR